MKKEGEKDGKETRKERRGKVKGKKQGKGIRENNKHSFCFDIGIFHRIME